MKDPKNTLADDKNEFVLTAVCRTITKVMNSNRKCMKRVFSSSLGYYFEKWEKYAFHTFSKN